MGAAFRRKGWSQLTRRTSCTIVHCILEIRMRDWYVKKWPSLPWGPISPLILLSLQLQDPMLSYCWLGIMLSAPCLSIWLTSLVLLNFHTKRPCLAWLSLRQVPNHDNDQYLVWTCRQVLIVAFTARAAPTVVMLWGKLVAHCILALFVLAYV